MHSIFLTESQWPYPSLVYKLCAMKKTNSVGQPFKTWVLHILAAQHQLPLLNHQLTHSQMTY
jgi:hypothetical protein